jgi:hypothetical protein
LDFYLANLGFSMVLNIRHQSERFNRKSEGRKTGPDGRKAANNPAGCLRMVDDEDRGIRPALEER